MIFDLTRQDCQYKGVLFAELDNQEVCNTVGMPGRVADDYCVGFMGLIWVDEKGIWNGKFRLKFPSENKQICHKIYDEEAKNNITVNETLVLHDFYRLPLIRKRWYKNESGKPEGILEILKESDMIESMKVYKAEESINE